jgi:Zn-dependent protease with chaperone function
MPKTDRGNFEYSIAVLSALILICAGLLAASLAFVTNWLALIPWRRSKGRHWSEQARLVFPVFVAARANLLTLPAVLVMALLLWWPDSSPYWVFTGIASMLGVYVGTFPLDHEVFPRIHLRDLIRRSFIGFQMGLLTWVIFIGTAVAMPDEFDGLALAIGGAYIVWVVIWSRGGMIWLGRKLGLFLPAPERLQRIADNTSARMNVPFREVLLVRAAAALAFAVPGSRHLMFTERLLEVLSDEELASVCAHELAHLTESKSARYARSIQYLMVTPWVFYKPLTHTFGMVAFFGLCGLTVLVPRIYRRISLKLESRADQMAQADVGDAGTYAHALTRLHEDNFLPAVTAKNQTTHPHLYDRILAAGVTPDFPRPEAAQSMAPHGTVFAALVGVLLVFVAVRALQASGATWR